MPKAATKEFRKPEKIEAILDATCRVMAQKGFAQISMNDIATEANEHKSLLFYYFKNKDQLFLELFHYLSRKYVDMISDIVELPINFDQKLTRGINTFHQFMVDEPKWFLMVLELIVHSTHQPENKSEVLTLYNQLMGLIRSGFEEARNSKEIKRKFNDDVVSSLIISTLIGLGVLNVLDNQATDFPKAYQYFKEIVDNFIKMKKK
jgi:AcrR family transcriptional regulator